MISALYDDVGDVSHIPEGLIVDVLIWKRMCGLRREKVISEQEVSVVLKRCNKISAKNVCQLWHEVMKWQYN